MSIGHLVRRRLFDLHTVLVGSGIFFVHSSVFVVTHPRTIFLTVVPGSILIVGLSRLPVQHPSPATWFVDRMIKVSRINVIGSHTPPHFQEARQSSGRRWRSGFAYGKPDRIHLSWEARFDAVRGNIFIVTLFLPK